MSELEKMLKDIVYGGVGAVASMLETGSGLAKTFVEKGQKIVESAKPSAEEWATKIKTTCDEALKATGVDLSQMTREQRDQLAEFMTKLDKVEDAAAKAMKDFAASVMGDKADGEEETAEDEKSMDVEIEEPETDAEDAVDPLDDDEEGNG